MRENSETLSETRCFERKGERVVRREKDTRTKDRRTQREDTENWCITTVKCQSPLLHGKMSEKNTNRGPTKQESRRARNFDSTYSVARYSAARFLHGSLAK